MRLCKFGSCETPCPPPVKTCDEQVAGKIQDREISTAAAVAQNKTEAASSRSAPAIPHADVTKSAQLSFDAQPRPTRKPLVARSSQPVLNSMHNVLADSRDLFVPVCFKYYAQTHA